MVIHPPNPKLENLPWRVNLGEPQQTVILRGTGLEHLARLASPEATWELTPARPEVRDLKERAATLKLLPAAHRGELISASLFVEEIQAPLEVPGVLQVAGPRPKIAGISKSFAQEPDVKLRAGEIPVGSAVSFALRAENLEGRPQLSLACANEGYAKQPLSLRSGDKNGASQLEFAGEGLLYLSLDPGVVGQTGCQLSATITTDSTGNSDPFALGRIIRLPRLAKFTLTEQKLGELYAGTLTGQDLQMIEKTGWDANEDSPCREYPRRWPGACRNRRSRWRCPGLHLRPTRRSMSGCAARARAGLPTRGTEAPSARPRVGVARHRDGRPFGPWGKRRSLPTVYNAPRFPIGTTSR